MTALPTCKCGRRTDLHDQFGNYRCSRCRIELWPHIFGPNAHQPVDVNAGTLFEGVA